MTKTEMSLTPIFDFFVQNHVKLPPYTLIADIFGTIGYISICIFNRYLGGFVSKLFLFALAFLSSGVEAVNWVTVSKNSDVDTYIDTDSVRRTVEGNPKLWVMYDLKLPESGKAKEKSTLYQGEFECKQEAYRFLSLVNYSDRMGKGDASIVPVTSKKYWPVVPGSIIEVIWKLVCEP
jgi:hypothetical protein